MEVNVESKTLIKIPISAQPGEDAQIIDLSILDQLHFPHHFSVLLLYAAPKHPWDSSQMRSSLAKALEIFYPLAGRLTKRADGLWELKCSNQGALFVEACANGKLQDIMEDLNPEDPCFNRLHLANSLLQVLQQAKANISEQPILLVQITTFECGGVAVGVSLNHNVGDMSALHVLLKAWAEISCNGQTCIMPIFEKSAVQSLSPPPPTFTQIFSSSPPPPQAQQPPISTKILKFTPQILAHLKSKASIREYTRFELAVAHIYQCIMQASGIEDDRQVKILIGVDCRKRLKPPLPQNYFGNAMIGAIAIANAGDLSSHFSFACEEIHQAIKHINDEYIRSRFDWITVREDIISMRQSSPHVIVTSWARIGVYDVDFGWGKPVYGGNVPCASVGDGLVYVLPILKEDEICFLVSLASKTMDKFLPLVTINGF